MTKEEIESMSKEDVLRRFEQQINELNETVYGMLSLNYRMQLNVVNKGGISIDQDYDDLTLHGKYPFLSLSELHYTLNLYPALHDSQKTETTRD